MATDVELKQHEREQNLLTSEVHHTLTFMELREIRQWRRKLLYKTADETERLIYEWVKTGRIARPEFTLLCKWHYQR